MSTRALGYYTKNSIVALCGLAAAFAFGLWVIAPLLLRLLSPHVTPPVGITIGRWFDSYGEACRWALSGALSAAFIWFAGALFGTGRRGDGRVMWTLLLLAAGIAGLLAAFFRLLPLQEGRPWALASVTVLSLFSYWLATWLCTPDTYKYTPWGATYFRSRLPW